jgi:hypothetical protein
MSPAALGSSIGGRHRARRKKYIEKRKDAQMHCDQLKAKRQVHF